MDYSKMEAGREMDALVAEKVMGWKLRGGEDHTKPKHRPSKDFPGEIIDDWDAKGAHDYLISPDGKEYYFCNCRHTKRSCDEIPDYSASISAAWEVVEKFDSFSIVHNAFYKKIGEEYIVCELTRYEPEAYAEARANTAPLAICRAALMAVSK